MVVNDFIVCNMHDFKLSACWNRMKNPATVFDAILKIRLCVMMKFVHTAHHITVSDVRAKSKTEVELFLKKNISVRVKIGRVCVC